MGIVKGAGLAAAGLLALTLSACSSVSDAGRQAATAAYRAAHPGAAEVQVARAFPLADCDYVEVSGTAGVEKMTVSRGSEPRVLQTATDGPGYFDGDYEPDALNRHCTAR